MALSPMVERAQPQSQRFSETQIAEESAAFLRKVYAIMSTGLGATGLTAYWAGHSEWFWSHMSRGLFWGLIIAELVLVWTLAATVKRVSAFAAGAMFFGYSVLNGLTLSVIFLLYTKSSIVSAFAVTAGTFAAMSLYGYTTKRNLDGVGHFMFMGLIGLIIASVVNIFLGSPMIYWMTTTFGVLIFVGLTAYDTQKIKELNVIGNAGTETDHKEAIHGALILYLDFVNLFLYLLRIFGRRR